jgi:hypothetical protein
MKPKLPVLPNVCQDFQTKVGYNYNSELEIKIKMNWTQIIDVFLICTLSIREIFSFTFMYLIYNGGNNS